MSEKTTVGGMPIECLTGEPAVIWSGWRTLGDRELVREASAKGTHIDLAYKCLAYRRNVSIQEAYSYFAKEVEIWIMELLEKHQVYRASHILKNVGRNPIEYVFDVCIKSKDPSLRNYLSEYMINVDRFQSEHADSWNIIKSIIEFEQRYVFQESLSSSICIDDILKLPRKVKEALCTEIYFSMTKYHKLKGISSPVLWEYLLSNDRIDLIRSWIDIHFNSSSRENAEAINENYANLFESFKITSDMIEYVDASYASSLVKELTKNHLCRYGVFVQKEFQDTRLMLSRVFGSAITLSQLDRIQSLPSCSIKKNEEFMPKVGEELCLGYCLDETTCEQSKIKFRELYKTIGRMCDAQECSEEAVIRGILESICYITDDIDNFLKENYLIVLALVFLYLHSEKNESDGNRKSLADIFSSKDALDISDYRVSNKVLQHTLKEIPILQHVIVGNTKEDDVTMYDLIDGYKNLNVRRLFKWRFENEAMPTFSCENLAKKYGYTESLTYGYYLKEGRPNMAIYNLIHVHGKVLGSISSRRKSKAALYAHMLTLRALDNPEVICSCISFIEMLGIGSENLRLHVTAASYVQEQLNISIGHMLEGIIYRNENDLKAVVSHLESSFEKDFNSTFTKDYQTFCDALKTWQMIVKFTRAHCYPLPQSFLLSLAKQNRWFEFILTCDVCAYPLSQVSECAKSFEDLLLREHVRTCLKHPELTKSQSVQGEQKSKYRETRQSNCYKTGSKQNETSIISSPVLSPTITSPVLQSSAFVEHSISNDNIISEEDDLWMIILKCHQSPDPPTALVSAARQTLRPVLTILASCYEPSSTPAFCYSWIAISSADRNFVSNFKECLDYQIWSARQVSDLLEQMILAGFTATLSRGFSVFMPDSCLNPFFEFLMQSVNYGDFKACQRSLYYFKSQCSSMKSNKIMEWDSFNTTYLTNLYWISVIAIKCIITALGYCLKSTHLQTKFLEVLCRCNFDLDLPVEVPNFQSLIRVTKILQNTSTTFSFKAYTLTENIYDFNNEIRRCINELLTQEDYSNALKLVIAVGFNPEEIILMQCRSEFKRSMEKTGRVENDFWKECASHFSNYNISCEKVAEFLFEHVEKVSSHKERYEILKLAFETIKDSSADKQTVDTLEMAMWKSCILAKPQDIQLDTGDYLFNKLKTELLAGLSSLQISCTLTNEHEKEATNTLINRLIDLGRLDVALRICTIFNYDHKDLEVLMLCLTLAEGETLPSDLTTEQRSLFPDANKPKQKFSGLKNRGLRRLSSSSSLASSIVSPTATSESAKTRDDRFYKIQQDCLSILESSRGVLKHGTEICTRILLCYKLAVKLDQTYQLLLRLNNPIEFLEETVDSNIDNKLEITSDIIAAYKINGEDVAAFLTENILGSITYAIEEGCDDVISLWGYPLNSNFHVIMELCSDVSLLGWQILKKANKLLGPSHGGKRNVATLKTVVELLIRSHDCFTTACNMEGIASILRKSQNLANILQTLRHWTLLVRLVMGVGRFTEMSYVFQILKENDQFEFLLGKGLDKASGLKTALLEYLKRQCPENKELFTLVALHFRLYYEIALMWENEAKDVIHNLISSAKKERDKIQSGGQELKLVRNEHLQKQLQLAITNFTHATQYYLQDNKLNLASRCADQAQLISLQLSLSEAISLNQQVVCILHLKTEEVDKILCHVLNFSQALIVIRAYNHHVDWTNLIYNHSVLKGETKYLKDFTSVIKLTPNLVQDCVRRYRLEKSITHKMTSNMKMLITELSDAECKYAMASQLGFKDTVEAMLNDPITGAYLKDTVWKKGYSSTS